MLPVKDKHKVTYDYYSKQHKQSVNIIEMLLSIIKPVNIGSFVDSSMLVAVVDLEIIIATDPVLSNDI